VGAAGGCIPVLVVPRDAAIILPHASFLDYCQFAYLLLAPTRADRAVDMRTALERLERVTAEEAAAKHATLRKVRDAFVWREPGQGGPSAADHILQAACAHARSAAAAEGSAVTLPAGRGVDGAAAGILTVGGKCVLA